MVICISMKKTMLGCCTMIWWQLILPISILPTTRAATRANISPTTWAATRANILPRTRAATRVENLPRAPSTTRVEMLPRDHTATRVLISLISLTGMDYHRAMLALPAMAAAAPAAPAARVVPQNNWLLSFLVSPLLLLCWPWWNTLLRWIGFNQWLSLKWSTCTICTQSKSKISMRPLNSTIMISTWAISKTSMRLLSIPYHECKVNYYHWYKMGSARASIRSYIGSNW